MLRRKFAEDLSWSSTDSLHQAIQENSFLSRDSYIRDVFTQFHSSPNEPPQSLFLLAPYLENQMRRDCGAARMDDAACGPTSYLPVHCQCKLSPVNSVSLAESTDVIPTATRTELFSHSNQPAEQFYPDPRLMNVSVSNGRPLCGVITDLELIWFVEDSAVNFMKWNSTTDIIDPLHFEHEVVAVGSVAASVHVSERLHVDWLLFVATTSRMCLWGIRASDVTVLVADLHVSVGLKNQVTCIAGHSKSGRCFYGDSSGGVFEFSYEEHVIGNPNGSGWLRRLWKPNETSPKRLATPISSPSLAKRLFSPFWSSGVAHLEIDDERGVLYVLSQSSDLSTYSIPPPPLPLVETANGFVAFPPLEASASIGRKAIIDRISRERQVQGLVSVSSRSVGELKIVGLHTTTRSESNRVVVVLTMSDATRVNLQAILETPIHSLVDDELKLSDFPNIRSSQCWRSLDILSVRLPPAATPQEVCLSFGTSGLTICVYQSRSDDEPSNLLVIGPDLLGMGRRLGKDEASMTRIEWWTPLSVPHNALVLTVAELPIGPQFRSLMDSRGPRPNPFDVVGRRRWRSTCKLTAATSAPVESAMSETSEITPTIDLPAVASSQSVPSRQFLVVTTAGVSILVFLRPFDLFRLTSANELQCTNHSCNICSSRLALENRVWSDHVEGWFVEPSKTIAHFSAETWAAVTWQALTSSTEAVGTEDRNLSVLMQSRSDATCGRSPFSMRSSQQDEALADPKQQQAISSMMVPGMQMEGRKFMNFSTSQMALQLLLNDLTCTSSDSPWQPQPPSFRVVGAPSWERHLGLKDVPSPRARGLISYVSRLIHPLWVQPLLYPVASYEDTAGVFRSTEMEGDDVTPTRQSPTGVMGAASPTSSERRKRNAHEMSADPGNNTTGEEAEPNGPPGQPRRLRWSVPFSVQSLSILINRLERLGRAIERVQMAMERFHVTSRPSDRNSAAQPPDGQTSISSVNSVAEQKLLKDVWIVLQSTISAISFLKTLAQQTNESQWQRFVPPDIFDGLLYARLQDILLDSKRRGCLSRLIAYDVIPGEQLQSQCNWLFGVGPVSLQKMLYPLRQLQLRLRRKHNNVVECLSISPSVTNTPAISEAISRLLAEPSVELRAVVPLLVNLQLFAPMVELLILKAAALVNKSESNVSPSACYTSVLGPIASHAATPGQTMSPEKAMYTSCVAESFVFIQRALSRLLLSYNECGDENVRAVAKELVSEALTAFTAVDERGIRRCTAIHSTSVRFLHFSIFDWIADVGAGMFPFDISLSIDSGKEGPGNGFETTLQSDHFLSWMMSRPGGARPKQDESLGQVLLSCQRYSEAATLFVNRALAPWKTEPTVNPSEESMMEDHSVLSLRKHSCRPSHWRLLGMETAGDDWAERLRALCPDWIRVCEFLVATRKKAGGLSLAAREQLLVRARDTANFHEQQRNASDVTKLVNQIDSCLSMVKLQSKLLRECIEFSLLLATQEGALVFGAFNQEQQILSESTLTHNQRRTTRLVKNLQQFMYELQRVVASSPQDLFLLQSEFNKATNRSPGMPGMTLYSVLLTQPHDVKLSDFAEIQEYSAQDTMSCRVQLGNHYNSPALVEDAICKLLTFWLDHFVVLTASSTSAVQPTRGLATVLVQSSLEFAEWQLEQEPDLWWLAAHEVISRQLPRKLPSSLASGDSATAKWCTYRILDAAAIVQEMTTELHCVSPRASFTNQHLQTILVTHMSLAATLYVEVAFCALPNFPALMGSFFEELEFLADTASSPGSTPRDRDEILNHLDALRQGLGEYVDQIPSQRHHHRFSRASIEATEVSTPLPSARRVSPRRGAVSTPLPLRLSEWCSKNSNQVALAQQVGTDLVSGLQDWLATFSKLNLRQVIDSNLEKLQSFLVTSPNGGTRQVDLEALCDLIRCSVVVEDIHSQVQKYVGALANQNISAQ